MAPRDVESTPWTPWYGPDMHVDDSTTPQPPQGEWWSDEPQMENYRHLMQMITLITSLRWLWRGRTDYFAAGNLTVYYSQVKWRSEDFRGPDFFVALDVDGAKERRSWVVWQEGGKYPNVIVELLSDTTEQNDRGEKKRIYEQIFRTPEYYLFDPETCELEGYRLVAGRYVSIEPNTEGRLACEQLGLLLGVRERELRFFTADGALVLKPDEQATQSMQQVAQAQEQLAQTQQQLEAQRQEIIARDEEIAALKKSTEDPRR